MMRAVRGVVAAIVMATVVAVGMFVIPVAVMAIGGGRPDPLCGRACHDPGVTENPNITLIGG